MAHPKAYDPQQGYKYQILTRQERVWEHCDYAKDKHERDYLLDNYHQAYGAAFEFKVIALPRKYWP